MKYSGGRGEVKIPTCPPEFMPGENRFCKNERLFEDYRCRAAGLCAIAAAYEAARQETEFINEAEPDDPTDPSTPLPPEEPSQPLDPGLRYLRSKRAQN